MSDQQISISPEIMISVLQNELAAANGHRMVLMAQVETLLRVIQSMQEPTNDVSAWHHVHEEGTAEHEHTEPTLS